jgi:hypothetical protein
MRIFMLLFSFALIFVACGDVNRDCPKRYRFNIDFSIDNPSATVAPGETIQLSSIISFDLLDQETKELVPVKDFDFEVEWSLLRIDGTEAVDGFNDFQIVYEAGSLAGQKINYQISGNQQRFEAVLSPQEKGIYYLSFQDPFVKDATYAVTDSPCKEYLPAVDFRMNGGSDNHFELLQLSPDPEIKKVRMDDFHEELGGYVFVVE